MLAGRKPLAVFSDYLIALPNEEIIPEEQFAPHVREGRFVREEAVINFGDDPKLGHDAKIKVVLFATRAEAWRIPAYRLVKQVFWKTRKNPEELERIESALLGYTEEEIDAWCDHVYRRNAQSNQSIKETR